MIRRIAVTTGLAAGAVGVSMLGGCKAFFDPSEMVRVEGDRLMVPILTDLDPMDESLKEFASAEDVRGEDLQVTSSDYLVGKNDLLTVSIYDLVNSAMESVRTARVSESGMITLPLLSKPIKAAGFTEAELQNEIARQYREANLITNPQVSVTVTEARQRTFSILGGVTQPGQYVIVDSNFRVLDALVLARDVTFPVDYAYVVRRVRTDAPATRPAGEPVPVAPVAQDPLAPQSQADAPRPMLAAADGAGVADALEPAATQKAPAGSRPAVNAAPGEEPPRYIYLDGKARLNSETQPAAGAGGSSPAVTGPSAAAPAVAAPAMPVAAPAPTPVAGPAPTAHVTATEAPTQPAFEFGGSYLQETRVIRIPLKKLKAGEMQYNVVIRPNDMVIVPSPPIGEYYVGGHVARPGVYTLTGRDITLKQAVISAAMLDPLANPTRADVIRRVGKDKEIFVRVNLAKIFEGKQPDVYLKPDDQLVVGTSIEAPFLAALRGAFRMTYGFGFLYDRNFAYGSQYYNNR